jgi:hypothetical protein
MRNTQLLAVYNDPKLNRFRESSRLQPLFKKRFNTAEIPAPVELPRTEESLPALHPNPTETTLQTPSQALRNRPVSGIKSETTDITRRPGELGVAELKAKLQRLKSERLELLKDLWTYEERYDKKLSMRARLLEMRGFCNYLDDMTTSSLAHIQDEQNLYDKMLVGVQSLLLKAKDKVEEAAAPQAEDAEEHSELIFQVATNVSGLHCLAFVKFTESFEGFQVTLHLDTACEVYSFEQAAFRLPSQGAKRGRDLMKNALKTQILPKLCLTASQDKLALTLKEPSKYQLMLLVQMTGSPYFYTQVQVTESSDQQDWVVTVSDPSVTPSPISLQVNKSSFGPYCELKGIANSQQAYLAETIRTRVSLIREEVVSLGLDMEQWRLDAPLEVTEKSPSLEFLKTMESPELTNDRYGDFEKLVTKGTVTVLNLQAEVEVSFNTVLELCRLTVTVDSFCRVIRAEDYPDVFELLEFLQFESLELSSQTLLQSLELRYVLSKLFSE